MPPRASIRSTRGAVSSAASSRVEAQGDGRVPAVHESLRVVPTDGGGVGPVRKGGVGDELELLVPPGLPEDQEDLADAVGQSIGMA